LNSKAQTAGNDDRLFGVAWRPHQKLKHVASEQVGELKKIFTAADGVNPQP
jgi:hypothetical protein